LAHPDLLQEIVVAEDQTLWHCHHQDVHQGMQTGELRFRIGRKDGEIRWIEHTCQPITGSQGGFLGIRASNRDITDRLQAELEAYRHREDLAHLSRVGVLGELTASLAHELNQPLTAILSNAQAGQRFLQGPAPDPAEVGEILKDIAQDRETGCGYPPGIHSGLGSGD
jgi:C4-dicarboxylate-specific signal transduction histidine kinase